MIDQYMTPADLAGRMVDLAFEVCDGKPSMRFLEPSSGTGRIARALRKRGHTTCVEQDPAMIEQMRQIVEPNEMIQGDFLAQFDDQALPLFDLCVMNPPFAKGLDQMFLRRAGEVASRVVALVRVNGLCGSRRYESVWSRAAILDIRFLSKRPHFTGPSDQGFGARHDFAVVHYMLGRTEAEADRLKTEYSGLTRVGWW